MNLSQTDRILAACGLVLVILAGQFSIYIGVRDGLSTPIFCGSLTVGASLTTLALSAVFFNDKQ
jgi:hypothetical protein